LIYRFLCDSLEGFEGYLMGESLEVARKIFFLNAIETREVVPVDAHTGDFEFASFVGGVVENLDDEEGVDG
jgi:hypothetical protein